MLFNSFEFLLVFLPLCLFIYFGIGKFLSKQWGNLFLVVASLIFYAYWRIENLTLILASILLNYGTGYLLSKPFSQAPQLQRKLILACAISLNLIFLGYFKYTHFILSNINWLSGNNFNIAHIILPLGISFFTFTQTAYLVDAYKGEVKDLGFIKYALFVTFFPHLIAGPILHHKEMIPQFEDGNNHKINHDNFSKGLFLLVIGLAKKVIIADTLAKTAIAGFDQSTSLTLAQGWLTSLSYTFQLYFDFSGYTDMALGIALLFNIVMPINFNSPYKATNLQDFWRRWHITLSRFLRDYLYIPLGGNRSSELRTCINLVVTFVLGGIWHGAGWTFIIWGALHGFGLVIQRLWQKQPYRMPSWLAWLITFNFVNIGWVFFRATSMESAQKVLSAMFGLTAIDSSQLSTIETSLKLLAYLLAAFVLSVWFKNSIELKNTFKPSPIKAILLSALMLYIFFHLNQVSTFLYFEF